MFRRLLVANARWRTCDELGITPVLGVSEADRGRALYARGARWWCSGRPAPRELPRPVRVVQAARKRVHGAAPRLGLPGREPRVRVAVRAHGVTFIGPPAHVMHLMGKKTPAKRAMARRGPDADPGQRRGSCCDDAASSRRGRWPTDRLPGAAQGRERRRRARHAHRAQGRRGRRGLPDAQAEAQAAFGDGRLYLERLIEGGRHVEIQIMADATATSCTSASATARSSATTRS
jgi:acetyl-CoA carboxylase, biotin carboxylase subunit